MIEISTKKNSQLYELLSDSGIYLNEEKKISFFPVDLKTAIDAIIIDSENGHLDLKASAPSRFGFRIDLKNPTLLAQTKELNPEQYSLWAEINEFIYYDGEWSGYGDGLEVFDFETKKSGIFNPETYKPLPTELHLGIQLKNSQHTWEKAQLFLSHGYHLLQVGLYQNYIGVNSSSNLNLGRESNDESLDPGLFAYRFSFDNRTSAIETFGHLIPGL